MKNFKVAIVGGDKIGWALDEDAATFSEALPPGVLTESMREADLVYAPWWRGLVGFGANDLLGKRVLCGFDNPPFYWMSRADFRSAREVVSHWICHSEESLAQAQAIGLPASLVRYAIRPEVFRPLADGAAALRAKWGLPASGYLIGNFQRDTEGASLVSPKLQKGPDVFAEIARELCRRGHPVHVVLAGPRRHWMRAALAQAGVPFTAIGSATEADDIRKNTLPRNDLNELYGAIDLYLLTSRWEGGPYALLEAAAARCKVVSSRVGQAMELLEPSCLFASLPEAIDRVERDIVGGGLAPTVEKHFARVQSRHRVVNLRPAVEDLLSRAETIPVFTLPSDTAAAPLPRVRENRVLRRVRQWIRRIRPVTRVGSGPTVSLFREFVKPPYGGGNQFMLALRTELQRRGVNVVNNKVDESIDGYILDSHWFDPGLLRQLEKLERAPRVVHRIDGPIHLYRGKDKDEDDRIFEINRRFATTTVIQSQFTLTSLLGAGYQPVRPVIVRNASNPSTFNRDGKPPFARERKVRIISSSWSGNARKGGDVYAWLDEHLDWSRFEYCFVGRAAATFRHIRQLEPVPSEQLAEQLKACDIYITASQNDPCSNALIEAQTCGLPAIYLRSGGHPELVGFGGLGFDAPDEIPALLDQVVAHYESFQNCIRVAAIKDVASAYLDCIREP